MIYLENFVRGMSPIFKESFLIFYQKRYFAISNPVCCKTSHFLFLLRIFFDLFFLLYNTDWINSKLRRFILRTLSSSSLRLAINFGGVFAWYFNFAMSHLFYCLFDILNRCLIPWLFDPSFVFLLLLTFLRDSTILLVILIWFNTWTHLPCRFSLTIRPSILRFAFFIRCYYFFT